MKPLLLAAFCLTVAAPARAEAVTPAKGAPERAAIMDALRAKGADKSRIFVVQSLKVDGEWAYAQVAPQSPDGRSRYEPESALLRQKAGHWSVVDQPCGEEDCDAKKEIARMRKAHPAAPATIFPQ
jgi:hypothetical protein